jgi:hypothetical protein
LVIFFYQKPEVFESEDIFCELYYANVWARLKDIDKNEKESAELILETSDVDTCFEVVKNGFWVTALLNVFFSMRQAGDIEANLNVDSDRTFCFNGLRYGLQEVIDEMLHVNLADFVGFFVIGRELEAIRRGTPECILRLLTIIFLDDAVFEQFINEGKESVQRGDLDQGATSSKSNIWKLIHTHFLNNDFLVAAFFLDNNMYRDSDGNLPDITLCKSQLKVYSGGHIRLLITALQQFCSSHINCKTSNKKIKCILVCQLPH